MRQWRIESRFLSKGPRKSSARDVGSCKIFREIFRESRYASLKRGEICCNFTLLHHALNFSFVSKPRWHGFSITGTSRRTRIRILSGNNAKGKDSYQHRRHRPRRLWQVDHNWPFDLQMRRNWQANNRKVREGGPRGKLGEMMFNVSLIIDSSVHRRTAKHSLKIFSCIPRSVINFSIAVLFWKGKLIINDPVKEASCIKTDNAPPATEQKTQIMSERGKFEWRVASIPVVNQILVQPLLSHFECMSERLKFVVSRDRNVSLLLGCTGLALEIA